jgi:uncharacterized membrane protein
LILSHSPGRVLSRFPTLQTEELKVPDKAKAVFVALGALATAVIVFLTTLGIVDWSDAQTALVTAEVGAIIGFVSALVAHRRKGTKEEWVALGATLTAAVTATLALGTGFDWWDLTEKEVSAVASLITAIIGIGAALFARNQVEAGTTR